MDKIKVAGIKLSYASKVLSICLLFLLFIVGGNAIAESNRSASNAEWTIIVYMDSDNNLEINSIRDMIQLENVGSSDEVKILVQWDRSPKFDSSNGNWSGAKRCLILNGKYQELEDLGDFNMANMESLVDFINWTRERYPANRYALVMWDHGGGWQSHT